LDRARDFAAALSKKLEPEPLAYAKMIGGEMSMARGDARNAIGLFQEAEQILDTWLGRLLLGRAYLEAGAFTEAYSEFELCLKRKGESASVFLNDLPSFRFFPPVYYYLGRAQEGLGSDAARGSYREFLRIKEKTDAGDPLVGDARSRRDSK
jgi:tetratricopeptide (TPR) repeat protein